MSAPRHSAYRPHKKQVLGHQAGQVPPAWRGSASEAAKGKVQGQGQGRGYVGSKILLSQLPGDVLEKEVEELFTKTVGPISGCFMIYNSQGRSKGMAVVEFTRPGDAVVARGKYNGKVVDSRKPLKIEIIVDSNSPGTSSSSVGPGSSQPSLLSRLGGTSVKPNPPIQPNHLLVPYTGPLVLPPLAFASAPASAQHLQQTQTQAQGQGQTRRRYKKGPRRLNKRQYIVGGGVGVGVGSVGKGKKAPVTREDLDKEMDEYRAGGEGDI